MRLFLIFSEVPPIDFQTQKSLITNFQQFLYIFYRFFKILGEYHEFWANIVSIFNIFSILNIDFLLQFSRYSNEIWCKIRPIELSTSLGHQIFKSLPSKAFYFSLNSNFHLKMEKINLWRLFTFFWAFFLRKNFRILCQIRFGK